MIKEELASMMDRITEMPAYYGPNAIKETLLAAAERLQALSSRLAFLEKVAEQACDIAGLSVREAQIIDNITLEACFQYRWQMKTHTCSERPDLAQYLREKGGGK